MVFPFFMPKIFYATIPFIVQGISSKEFCNKNLRGFSADAV
jgi:hypothetical protein